jgi:hypothetical protein
VGAGALAIRLPPSRFFNDDLATNPQRDPRQHINYVLVGRGGLEACSRIQLMPCERAALSLELACDSAEIWPTDGANARGQAGQ